MKKKPIILIDMDGVLADFDRHFMAIWAARYPNQPQLDQTRRTCFRIAEEFDQQYRRDVLSVFEEPGFFLDLPKMPGAITAMQAMEKAGYDAWICSSPLMRFRHCVTEKYQWVERELGPEWMEKLILTRRKIMVRGDILIDDKPFFQDAHKALWKHALFNAPYNQGYPSTARITWENWETVLPELLSDVHSHK